MDRHLLVVEGLVLTALDTTDVREEVWGFALDQRAFGPRKLVVAFADRDGRFTGLAYTDRTSPPETALAVCIDYLGADADAAVALCDEPVSWGPPPADVGDRLARARAAAADLGVHLVDWIACDDQLFCSFKLAVEPGGEWWDVP
jgi:hypothetical protein